MIRAQTKIVPAIAAAALAMLIAAPANSASYTGSAALPATTPVANAKAPRSALPAATADGSFQVAGWRDRRGYRGGLRFGRNFTHRRGRHHYGRHHRRYRNHGLGIAGAAAAIIGGAIANSRRSHAGRWERCDERYRTFRWSDGTYIPYVGSSRVLCPYLRR